MSIPAGLLTYEDIAARIGCAVRTVRRMVARRQIRCVRLSHRLVRFRQADVDADLEKLTTKTI